MKAVSLSIQKLWSSFLQKKDKQTNAKTDKWTNRQGKNYMPPIYQCKDIKILDLSNLKACSHDIMNLAAVIVCERVENFVETTACQYPKQWCNRNIQFNPFPNKPWFLLNCSTSLLKTLWEKEGLLVTSNFSFSLSVFYQFGQLSAFFIKSKIVLCKVF